jgi:hypothetical protein
MAGVIIRAAGIAPGNQALRATSSPSVAARNPCHAPPAAAVILADKK